MPFGNRRGSARGACDDDEPDTSGRPKSGGLAKIVRAASFSRRKKNDETSSGSSSTQSSPTADGTPLKGWLSKRHNKEKSVSQQWGRRYFSVDGVRGMRGGSILGGGGDELHGVSSGGGGCGQRSVDGVRVVWGWLSFGGGCGELHAVPGWVG